ncbi:MAG TPA: iron-sulfur cluster assembly accessory protein [Guyparkeria sp.]|nr:iron-sulfur cluster assembly accessory protein [Guyparkeria sp.]
MTAEVHSAQSTNQTTATAAVDPAHIEAARARAAALPTEQQLSLTDPARQYLHNTLGGDEAALGLRLGIKKSGCTGFAYVMDVARSVDETDLWFDCSEGIAVISDQESFKALQGSTLDYVVDGLTRMLKVNNPNVEDSCGCGESFNVRDQA